MFSVFVALIIVWINSQYCLYSFRYMCFAGGSFPNNILPWFDVVMQKGWWYLCMQFFITWNFFNSSNNNTIDSKDKRNNKSKYNIFLSYRLWSTLQHLLVARLIQLFSDKFQFLIRCVFYVVSLIVSNWSVRRN